MTAYASQLLKTIELLQGYARKLICNSDMDVDDLIQETLLKALRSPKDISGQQLISWLATIMHNTAINGHRKHKRCPISRNHDVSEIRDKFHITSQDLPDTDLLLEEIHAAIDTLSDTRKRFLQLWIDGYAYKEIAEKESIPIGTVKSTIHFARKDLKKYMEDETGNSLSENTC